MRRVAKRRPARQPPRGDRREASRGSRSRSRRRSWWQSPTALGGGALAVVVVAVILVVVVASGGGGSTPGATPVPAEVLSAVARPDPAALATIGTGGQSPTGNLTRLPGASVQTRNSGKPVVIYLGAEYCPFCAAERWVIVSALSRFGTFSHLQEATSSSTDVYPDTSTFTFAGASYTSASIDFQPTELEDRNRQPLQSPSPQVANAFATYDQPPYTATAQGFPFLDIGGRYTLYQTSFSPQLLQGLSWSQIATKLSNPADPVTQAMLGNANILTAAICTATGNQPASVCSAPSIQSIEASLASLKPPSS